jgi:hypothetical protein
MLWALLAVAIAGAIAGGAGAADALAEVEKFWRDQIKKRLKKNPEAQSKAYAVVSGYKEKVQGLQESVAERAKSLRAVHANYGSTYEEYAAVVERLGEDIQSTLDGFVQSAIDLRAAMGKEAYRAAYADVQKEMAEYRKKQIKAEKKAEKKAARKRS